MPEFLDQPSTVRADAGFDVQALARWMRANASDTTGLDAEPELLQFGKGYSNLTYLVRFGARELVVRRAPPGVNIKSAHDMGREFRILSALSPVWPKVPRPLALCDDPSVIGSSFYVMERVAGTILRARVPDGLVLDEAAMRRISHATCDTLAEIHNLDWKAAGLGDLGKPEGYVDRQ